MAPPAMASTNHYDDLFKQGTASGDRLMFLTPHHFAVLVLYHTYSAFPYEKVTRRARHDIVALLLDHAAVCKSGIEEKRTLQHLLVQLPDESTPPIPIPGETDEAGEPIYSTTTSWRDAFLTRLDDALQSVNTMLEVLDLMNSSTKPVYQDEKIIQHPKFTVCSPFGTYIRNAMVDRYRLKDDLFCAYAFFDALKAYRDEGVADGGMMDTDGVGGRKPPLLSLADVEQQIDAHVRMMEDSTEPLTPAALHQTLTSMQTHITAPIANKADWASFLNCMRAGEFEGALQNLSRYFMYLMKEQPGEGTKWVHHFTLFSMASVYARFGYRQLALETVDRAIPLAQDMHDTACLNLLQNLKHRLRNGSLASGPAQSALRFESYYPLDEIQDPEEAAMLSFTRLNNARHFLETLSTPTLTFHHLSLATHLATTHSLPPSSLTILHAHIWSHHGSPTLSHLFASMYTLPCSPPDCSSDDGPLGLCILATHHARQGDYDVACGLLKRAKQRWPAYVSGPAGDRWIATTLDILFARALRRGEVGDARQYAGLFEAVVEPTREAEALFSCEVMRAWVCRAEGRAEDGVEGLLGWLGRGGGARGGMQVVECRLAIAELFLDASAPMSALPHTLAALTLSTQSHLPAHRTRAALLLCACLCEVGYYAKAEGLLEKVLPSVWTGGDVVVGAEGCVLWGECKLGRVLEGGGEGVREVAKGLVGSIQQALADYEHLQDLDGIERAATLLACLYRLSGTPDPALTTTTASHTMKTAFQRALDIPALRAARAQKHVTRDVVECIVAPEGEREGVGLGVLFGCL
ncbi:uncharacterized protein EV422DRAFT_617640 [Fimicolochytrium jonesii]|uniref:uncharacterized protein n=1 Tax=Fimicolochytrium jonesii TaxID=1396493 RepID=UPI0022FE191B|nr:uncharacterized protein EV422DRAFT_617640 [Fimicolochytrium jonesii]KAI8825248.1 hypothetical protein EV422DRAFT_617640 [Fimicolochytrium jonesii]